MEGANPVLRSDSRLKKSRSGWRLRCLMFKPQIKSGRMIFNVKSLTDPGEEKLIGFQGIEMIDIGLLDNGPVVSFDVANNLCRLSAVNNPFGKFYPFCYI